MHALVYLGPRELALREIEAPAVGPDEVLVKVEASGICGSDLHGYLGKSKKRVPPLVMGHEVAGRVHTVGTAVQDLVVGSPVAVYPLITCGRCASCRRGVTTQCASRRLIGIDQPGGYAEYVAVPRASVVPLPRKISMTAASLAEPLANAVHIFNRNLAGFVQSIAIFGAGPQGLMALHLARLIAPEVLISVDIVPARRDLALRLGATVTLDGGDPDTPARVLRLTDGDGVDLAIEAVGTGTTRTAALASVRGGGRIVFLGLGEGPTTIDAVDVVNRELEIHGSYGYTYDDFTRAVALLSSRAVSAAEWVTTRPLEDGPMLFEQLVTDPGDLVKAVLVPRG